MYKMRKTNAGYLSALLASGLIVGFGVAYALIRDVHQGFAVAGVVFGVVACLILLTIVKNIVFNVSLKRFEQTFVDKSFYPESSFLSSNSKIYIDAQQGKIGIISKMNPFHMYFVNHSDVQKAWVSDGKMMGGTRLVQFCFTINETTWRVPTLTANTTLSMNHKKVLHAINVAENYCKIMQPSGC